jgi:hypothetical protein
MTVPAGLVTDAVTEITDLLGPHADADWSVAAHDLDWSCWLAAFPRDYPRYRRRVPQLVPGLRLFLRGREPAA